jgi:hypothetical protein
MNPMLLIENPYSCLPSIILTILLALFLVLTHPRTKTKESNNKTPTDIRRKF